MESNKSKGVGELESIINCMDGMEFSFNDSIFSGYVKDLKKWKNKFLSQKQNIIGERPAQPTASNYAASLSHPSEGVEELLKQMAWAAWKSAANAYRMYPDNKHTFTDYWHDLGKKEAEDLIAAHPQQSEGGEKTEMRLALTMLVRVFKRADKTSEQQKYYDVAESMLKKWFNATDVFRDDAEGVGATDMKHKILEYLQYSKNLAWEDGIEELQKMIDWLASTQISAPQQSEGVEEIERYKLWVADLQSGMYVNCVYCGHRYGREDETPVAMADVLKAHIEQCPEHPLSKALARIKELETEPTESPLKDGEIAKMLFRVNRVEVIDDDGRSYVNWRAKNKVSLMFQDDDRTLKIFITEG